MQYQIKVAPEKSYMDENVEITISGNAGEQLELRLSTDDYYNVNGDLHITEVGTKWFCTIPLVLDDHGIAKLDAKVFTELKIIKEKKSSLEQDLNKVSENRNCHIHMELSNPEKIVASIDHLRMFCDESVISENIIEHNLLARYFVKSSLLQQEHSVPGIVVVSGSDGRIEKAQAIAQCLAMKGYATISVCYYGMNHVSKDLSLVPMEYIKNAIEWLKKRNEVDSERIGIYGRSKGGEMVLIAGTLFPELKCVVANTPSNYIQEGLTRGIKPSGRSTWSYQGNELPFVKDSFFQIVRLLAGMIKKDNFAFRKFYQGATWKYNEPITPEARIKIEETEAAYLLISSDTDGIWPSDQYAKEAVKYMQHSGKKNYEHFCYHKSGHMLTIPYQAIPNCEEYGGILKEGVSATIDSWEHMISFLNKYL